MVISEEKRKQLNDAIKRYNEERRKERLEKVKKIKEKQPIKEQPKTISKPVTQKTYEEASYTPAEPMSVQVPIEKTFTPAPTIKTYKDKDNNIIGIEDVESKQSIPAPKGYSYEQESINKVEKERAETLEKNIRLQDTARRTTAAQEELYKEYFTDKDKLKQTTGEKVLGLLGVKSVSDKKVEEYKKRAEEINKDYFGKTFTIYTGKQKPDSVKVSKDVITGAKPSYYLNGELKPDKVSTLKGYVQSEKELRESGYYYLKNKQGMTTFAPTEREKKVLSLGQEVEEQQSRYVLRKGFGTGGKALTIIYGGTLVSKALSVTPLGTSGVVTTIGKGLDIGYKASVGARGYYDVYKPIKEKDYLTAGENIFDLTTEVASVKIMTDLSKAKITQDRPILQKEGTGYRFERRGTIDKDIFGGRFKKDIVTTGYVKEGGEFAYTTDITRKGKLLTNIRGSFAPTKTGYVGVEQIGKKVTPLEYKTEVVYKRGTEQPFLSEGEQRLALVRKGLKLDVGKKFIEYVDVKGEKIETGRLFARKTPYSSEYVSLVGEIRGLSAPLKTNEVTTIGNQRLSYKGGRLEQNVKYTGEVAGKIYQQYKITGKRAQFGLTPQGVSSYKSEFAPVEQPIFKLTGKEAFIPVFSPSSITPKPFTVSRQETVIKQKPKEVNMVRSQFKLETNQLRGLESEIIIDKDRSRKGKSISIVNPKGEEEFKPIIKPEIIQERKPEIKPIEITKPDEVEKVKTPTPPPPIPPPVPPPVIITPPVLFGLRPPESTRRPALYGFRQPKTYSPSLLGIEKGLRATKTTGLSGFEIRGIQNPIKIKKSPKTINIGGFKVQPVKSGIGMKFKILKRPNKTLLRLKKAVGI